MKIKNGRVDDIQENKNDTYFKFKNILVLNPFIF